MTHDQLVPLIRQASRDVFGTMLGVELKDSDAYIGESAPCPSDGVLALVGLAGAWAGSGTFSCSADMACKLSGQLLMSEYSAVDEDVLDAIGEIANMVIGNVKTGLEENLGPMGLSIPTVIYGRNFTTRSVGKSNWTVVPFSCMGEQIEVNVCLVRNKDGGSSRAGAERESLAAVLSLPE
jgi:chemotaxis protein CheX